VQTERLYVIVLFMSVTENLGGSSFPSFLRREA